MIKAGKSCPMIAKTSAAMHIMPKGSRFSAHAAGAPLSLRSIFGIKRLKLSRYAVKRIAAENKRA